jgi:methylated-DNA-[protein]-cysteine S-methyltransferase
VSHVAMIDSPTGTLTIMASDTALQSVMWSVIQAGRPQPTTATTDAHHQPVIAATIAQLRRYFAGDLTRFDLPLEPYGTEMQQAVWHMLIEIPIGETWSYGQMSSKLGRPTGTRAVANAIGRNPIGIIIPCHRVIGSDGSLTGFAGGLDAKRWLLDHERAGSAPALPFA